MFSPAPQVSDIHVGQPKALYAYQQIRRAIIAMQLVPGAMLNEKAICKELAISRTPMREALLRLAQEGLIHIAPSEGTFVSKMDVRKMLEGHLIRASLETQMVAIAARHYDDGFENAIDVLLFRQRRAMEQRDVDTAFLLDSDFHKILCAVAGFPNVWKTIQAATGQLDRARRLAFPHLGFLEEAFIEHSEIYVSIKNKDAERAASQMHKHLSSIKEIILFAINNIEDCVALDTDHALLAEISAI